jgi:hypothetical protein
MTRRTMVQLVTAIVVVVFAVGILTTGGTVSPAWLRFYSVAVVVALFALALWDHWLWHLPVFQRIPGVPRDVRGTWKGQLRSYWRDPESGTTPAPVVVFLVVRQTATRITARLISSESTSQSSLAALSADDGVWSLAYLYLNRPSPRHEARSRMHNGSTHLQVSGLPASRLQGRYWTDRDSRGELEFIVHIPRACDDWRSAVSALGL